MRVLTDSRNYEAITEAIRERLGSDERLRPGEMAEAIREISGGNGIPLIGRGGRELGQVSLRAAEGMDAFDPPEEEEGLLFAGWTATPGQILRGGVAPVGRSMCRQTVLRTCLRESVR